MAKHANDPGTLDAFPVKRGRGRPSTGHAMSDAERARRYRERRREAGISVTQKTITQKVEAAWPEERARLVAQIERLEREVVALTRERAAAFMAADEARSQARTLHAVNDAYDAERQQAELAAYDRYEAAKRLVPASGPIKRSAVEQIISLMRQSLPA